MSESPAEYISRLEAENRALKSAAVSSAQTAERALARLQEWDPLVYAAIAFVDMDGRAGTQDALRKQVALELKRRLERA